MSELANLRRLDAFVAVAEELHFGRAADRLHIAQPALSQQIRQLEADLGLALLERTTRRVGLTPDGAAFLPHARQLLVSAQGVARAAEELRVGARGRLRLGFVDSTAFEFVPWFLRRFRSAWPEADVELHTMSSDEQARALVDGDIDLGVARTVPVRPAVDSAVLGHDRFMLAVPADHTVAGQRTVSLRRLAQETFVGFSRTSSPSLHAELRSLLGGHGVGYDPAIEATEYTTIVGLVAAGEGVALVPAGVRRLQLPNVAYVKVADADARVALVRLSRIDEPQTIVANAITELARIAAQ
ncbi:MAG: LysR family transcriptional regulator [Actinobacteria bacterium]|jgi:DNA-binding transcriptional LysR family regulator|nr:LysR family transcriptional regulator [Actinomycetota bacterium]NDH75445.1 LysR family transcriptional regulator [Actinomycetota bacterium]